MKKKFFAILTIFVITIPILTFTVSGATPRWTLFSGASVVCAKETGNYAATITSDRSVTRLEIHVMLYEKSLFTDYTLVSSIDRTIYDSTAVVSSHYPCSTSKTYKVELISTAYSSSGQIETIRIEETF